MRLPRRLVMSLASVLVTAVAVTAVLLSTGSSRATASMVPTGSSTSNAGLIIFSTSPGASAAEQDAEMIYVRYLDTLVGQVRHDYTVVDDADLGHADLAKYQYVIYFGAGAKQLPADLVSAIDAYKGPFYAFNANADQFTAKLPWLRIHGNVLVNRVTPAGGKGQALSVVLKATSGAGGSPPPPADLPADAYAYDVSAPGADVTLTGTRSDGGGSVPLAMHVGHDYYYASANLSPPLDQYVTESLLQFFGQRGTGITKYLRLEDVSPQADPQLLMEAATWLKQQHIPYLVAVIPVYSYGATTVHLDQRPNVVKALQYMQANGGSIVMHGYTHQYRSEETGEGFEFWDAANDRPIYQPADAKAKLRSDFATEAAWEAFVKQGEAFERSYIEDRVTRGVQELVAEGLYPLAFEAPHYAMSQLGYKILSEHFSSYVGALQMSDSSWMHQYAPPSESQPEMLDGMTLYPETLGYIAQGAEEASLKDMQQKLESRSQFSQAYLSAFYHPYLGLDGLEKVVRLLQTAPGTWLNLKQRHNVVEAGGIRITSEGGEIHVAKSSWISSNLAWLIPAIVVLLIVAGFVVLRKGGKGVSLRRGGGLA